MRHQVYGNQFGRRTNVARALYRGLISQVLENGRIKTTHAKAKAIRGDVDRVIGYGKKADINARRELVKLLGTDRLTDLVFTKVAPSLSDRTSGYTRIVRLGQRFSDTADKVFIELVNYKPESKVKKEETPKVEKAAETTSKKEISKVKTIKVKKAAGVKRLVTVKKSGER